MFKEREGNCYCGEFGLATAASSDSEESGASSLTNDLVRRH